MLQVFTGKALRWADIEDDDVVEPSMQSALEKRAVWRRSRRTGECNVRAKQLADSKQPTFILEPQGSTRSMRSNACFRK